jgi:lysylphosphatidylglycerol synthetase-like protein (DUF2156 family)
VIRVHDARAAAADTAAILAFAVVGMASHHRLGPAGLLRDALPLLACWLAVGAAIGLYRRGGARRLLATWIVAVPLGVLVRALALGRAFDRHEAAFLATTLVFTLLFVAIARAGVRFLRIRAAGARG